MSLMATQAFAERATERALDRDLSSREGAEHLAKCITAYWAARGVKVSAEVVSTGERSGGTGSGGGGIVWGVRTTGIPVARGAPPPAVHGEDAAT